MTSIKKILQRHKRAAAAAAAVMILAAAAAFFLLWFGRSEPYAPMRLEREGSAKEIEKDGGRKQKLVVAAEQMTGAVNPAYVSGDQDKQISDLVFEPLMRRGQQGDYEPVLADSVEISEDGLTYTIHLKSGITFTDGTVMTADDVRASLAAAAFQKGMYSGTGYDRIEGVGEQLYQNGDYSLTGIKTLDEDTVQVRFTEASPDNLQILETGIQKRDIVDFDSEHPFSRSDRFQYGGVGTGAYEIAYEPNGNVTVLKASAHSRKQAGRIQEIEFRYVNYYDTLEKMQENEVDLVWYSPDAPAFENIYQEEDFTVYSDITDQMYYLGFNKNGLLGSSRELRRAVAGALDAKALFENKEVSRYLYPLNSILPGGESGDGETPREDVKELAGKAAEEIGLDSIELTMPVLRDDPLQNAVAERLAEDLQEAGISLKAEVMSEEDYVNSMYGAQEFDLYLSSTKINETAEALEALMSDRDMLPVGIESEPAAEALERLKTSYTPEALGGALEELEKTVREEALFVPLGRKKSYFSISADLKGYEMRLGSGGISKVENIR